VRFEHALQTARGLGAADGNLADEAVRGLQRTKWRLWHGRWPGCRRKLGLQSVEPQSAPAPRPSAPAPTARPVRPQPLAPDNPAPCSARCRPSRRLPARWLAPQNAAVEPGVSAAWTVAPLASASPSSIAMGQHWTQVNTDPRNDPLSRMPSFLLPEGGRDQIGMVAAIKSVAWPPSNRNRWPRCIGICIP
jgi:hypothetical protein